jgi:hypothetical protein
MPIGLTSQQNSKNLEDKDIGRLKLKNKKTAFVESGFVDIEWMDVKTGNQETSQNQYSLIWSCHWMQLFLD